LLNFSKEEGVERGEGVVAWMQERKDGLAEEEARFLVGCAQTVVAALRLSSEMKGYISIHL
jgi:hypothetical protein